MLLLLRLWAPLLLRVSSGTHPVCHPLGRVGCVSDGEATGFDDENSSLSALRLRMCGAVSLLLHTSLWPVKYADTQHYISGTMNGMIGLSGPSHWLKSIVFDEDCS